MLIFTRGSPREWLAVLGTWITWVLPLMETCVITVGSSSTYLPPFLQAVCSYLHRAVFLDFAAFSNVYTGSAVPALPAVTPNHSRSKHMKIKVGCTGLPRNPVLMSTAGAAAPGTSGSQAACSPVPPVWGTCIILMHLLYWVEILDKAYALIYQVQVPVLPKSDLTSNKVSDQLVFLKQNRWGFLLVAFWGGRF